MASQRIELGDTVKDSITGFEGVVVCVYQWLHGCRRMSVQPKELKDGKPIEPQTFDEPQLILLESVRPLVALAKTGGPQPDLPRH